VARPVVSGLVLIFLAVASVLASMLLASRPARAMAGCGQVQARRGSSRMRWPPYRGLR
jgi:hypothetical protein